MASSSVRERKKAAGKKATRASDDIKDEDLGGTESELNPYTAVWLVLVFVMFVGSILYYQMDQKKNGPFAAFINKNVLPKNRYQNGI